MSKLNTSFMLNPVGFIRKLILLIVLSTMVLSIWSVHKGALEFKKARASGMEHQKSQESRFSYMFNYKEYSKYGFSIKFIPSQNVVYFSNPPVMGNLSLEINSIELLELENSAHGGFAFKGNTDFRFRFQTIIQVFFSLAVMLLGFEAFYNKEYIRLISDPGHHARYFFTTVIKRFLLTSLVFLAIFGITKLFVVVAHGLPLSGFDFEGLARYTAVTLLMLLIFLLTGTAAAHCRNAGTGLAVMASVWGLLVFIVPIITDSIRAETGESLPTINKLNNDKLGGINTFEKKAEREHGSFRENTIEAAREVVEVYRKEVFPKVEAVDIVSRDQTAVVSDDHNRLCRWMPTTFYNITAQETGSRGYGNLVVFYDHAIKLRREFVRFWIDRVYYHDPKELLSFIKEKGYSYLFTGACRKPAYFDSGIVNMCAYILILFSLSYILNKRSLTPLPGKEFLQREARDIELDKGPKLSVWLDTDADFNNLLYNVFSGKSKAITRAGFKGKLTLDEIDLIDENQAKTLCYVPSPQNIPSHLRVRELFSQYIRWHKIPAGTAKETINGPGIQAIWRKPFGHLGKAEQFDTLMSLTALKKAGIYLFYDTLSGFPGSYATKLKDRMYERKETGALVLYLTTTETIPAEEPGENRGLRELENWEYTVEANRMLTDNKIDGGQRR